MSEWFPESEHQELFYPRTRLQEPLALHVPSALGALRYFVFVRVPADQAAALGAVSVTAKLTGLRSTDVTVRAGEGLEPEQVTAVASKVPGLIWVPLCRVPMARGDGTFTFRAVPAGVPEADVLFCTWRRFVTSGQADDWLACQADPCWAPGGVPLGGIGVGRVDLCRDGRFRNFSGNNNQDMPFEEPDGLDGAFLSVTDAAGDERLLATRPMRGLAPCASLAFEARFPRAVLTATDVWPGVDVAVTGAGLLTPHDVDTACLPAALLRWRVSNRTAEPVTLTCRLAWPNCVGTGGGLGAPESRTGYGDGFYRYWPAPDAPSAEAITRDGVTALRYGNRPSPICAAADGFHWIAAGDDGGTVAVDADPRHGSLRQTLTVPGGASVILRMALVWEMPHWIDSLGDDRGRYWMNRHPNGQSLLRAIFSAYDDLFERAGALAALLDDSDLPDWLRRRLSNCCYPLVTNSVLYRDGRFSINEGPTEMSGVYGTIDQRLGAHAATQLLFPSLNRCELDLFSAVMTEHGEVNHDLGSGHLERGPAGQKWPDILCSYAIQQARHAWTTGDAEFEAMAWPRVRKVLRRHGEWADAGGGVAQLGKRTGLGTSYDSYHYEGTTAYMATLWIAALQVGCDWARRTGDAAFVAQAERWVAAARERLDADLWNGAWYRAYGGVEVPANENSHGGMLAGVWFARMLAGADVLDPVRQQACAGALLERHGSAAFAVPPDEVAPDGGSGSLYGWLPYIASFMLAPLAILRQPGMLEVWERMVRCMDADGLYPCDTRLMYRPQTGAPSWGAWYMTAPADWLVYDAMLDFCCFPREGVLRLDSAFEGRFAVVHPRFWATGERRGERRALTVRAGFGAGPVVIRMLELTADQSLRRPDATGPGERRGRYRRLPIAPVTLTPGAVLAWETEPAG